MEPDETPEQRLRAGLFAVHSRWESIHRGGGRVTALSTAMALEAVQALTDAYPTDPLYRSMLAELEHLHPPADA